MEKFIAFVQDWGYWAVFLGSLVEGESVILTASAMASQGYLSLPKIMIIAFFGTLFADQALFFVGRKYGPSLFERYPRLKLPSDKAFKLLHKMDSWFILSFRFIYGIRIVSPIVIGAAGISPQRFLPLNFISAIIWTIISCVGGYMLGDVMLNILENFHTYQKYFLMGVAGIACIIAGVFLGKKKCKK